MESKYLYLGKNIIVNEKGEIKDFLNLGTYQISLVDHLGRKVSGELYTRKDFSRYFHYNFFGALKDGFKHLISFNCPVTFNIIKELSKGDASSKILALEDKKEEILTIRLYREKDIIFLNNILRYNIRSKELIINGSDLFKDKIVQCIPKRFSRKNFSLRGVSFNLKYIYPENKDSLKINLLKRCDEMSRFVNFDNIENFSVVFEETRKKRDAQLKKSGGYYVANKRLISLNTRGEYFIHTTLFHEFGHHIDYSLQRKYGGSFMKTIKKYLYNALIEEITLSYIRDNKTINNELKSYLLSHNEIFARLIAEYLKINIDLKNESYDKYSASDIYSEEKIKSILSVNPYWDCREYRVKEYRFTIEEIKKCEPILKRLLNL